MPCTLITSGLLLLCYTTDHSPPPQSIAAASGTLVGTAFRIPCEVLKQRLQIGLHNNFIEAAQVAVAAEGVRG